MAGHIRSKEKCPRCGGKFAGQPLACPCCKTAPTRFYLDFPWQGQKLKIYSGPDGHPLDSWARAQRLLEAMRSQVDRGLFDPRDYAAKELRSLRCDNYFRAWLARREEEGARGRLSRSYLKDLRGYVKNYWIPYFQSQGIRDLREGDLEDFLAQLPGHLSAKTLHNLLGALHKLLADAYRRRDILRLPDVPRVQVGEPVTRWLTREQQDRVIRHVQEPYRTFYLFLMRQGCRPGEGRALRWEDVDLREGVVVIRAAFDQHVYRPYTKERDVRYLPLHPDVAAALRRLPRALTGYVFVNRRGAPLSARRVYEHWRRAAEKAQVRATCYQGTRHSLASQAINMGVSERLVGEMLGHKTSASTRRYAKTRTEALRLVWSGPGEQAPDRPQGEGDRAENQE